MPKSICTTCPYCGTGCGVRALVSPNGDVEIAGDPAHPANFGRLCVKGAALAETLTSEGRLLHPEAYGNRVSWSEALGQIAARFRTAIDEHGPDSVALYVSGQMLTEDYYVANKLMKGFIGSANIDSSSRLCMASSVAAHKLAFGADTVPNTYEDLERADLVVLVGSNLAWCHPVLYQRLERAKADRPSKRIVTIDPRRTATSEIADLHLSLAPGSDVALFAGLLRFLARNGKIDAAFVAQRTNGFDAALREAEPWDVGAVARETGLGEEAIAGFYDLFAARERVVTVYSQGVNQSSAGTDKVASILDCHLATGRIGKPGTGPFSVTGQPNAMGGREVGGLANQLACHMELSEPRHREIVQKFWKSPTIAAAPGLKAVELFEAVGAGRIESLWIIGSNPVDSLPDADEVRRALRSCPFVAVSDVCAKTDTTELAHVLLPARPWGEKDGTVTNSERRISRQRAFLPAKGEAMPDWWALARVARLMGYEGFDFTSPADIFREHAALSGYLNDGERDFDISACADLDRAGYDSLAPFQWPWRRGEAASDSPKRFFADGRFFTNDGRANFVATAYRPPRSATSASAPFVLNTGRVRDQWHTMTRTGLAPRLSQHITEPYAEIHPQDAAALGIAPAGLARISNAQGAIVVRALVTERQRKGSVFAPIHWTDQNSSAARVGALVAAHVDPISGQPESKASAANVEAWPAKWFGFALMREKPHDIDHGYWATARTRFGWRLELASLEAPQDWDALARTLFRGDARDDISLVTLHDGATASYRCVATAAGRIIGLLFASPEPVRAAREWLCERFAEARPDVSSLLAGRPVHGRSDPGHKVCVCHDVGANAILTAVRRGCANVDEIGAATGAGTGCGCCRPEIARLLNEATRSRRDAASETTMPRRLQDA